MSTIPPNEAFTASMNCTACGESWRVPSQVDVVGERDRHHLPGLVGAHQGERAHRGLQRVAEGAAVHVLGDPVVQDEAQELLFSDGAPVGVVPGRNIVKPVTLPKESVKSFFAPGLNPNGLVVSTSICWPLTSTEQKA